MLAKVHLTLACQTIIDSKLDREEHYADYRPLLSTKGRLGLYVQVAAVFRDITQGQDLWKYFDDGDVAEAYNAARAHGYEEYHAKREQLKREKFSRGKSW